MIFEDHAKSPVEGYFKIEVFDKDGNVIDEFEQQNTIMLNSKNTMQYAMAGRTATDLSDPANPVEMPIMINTFMLGTKGHQGTNILIPRNFDYTMDKMFSFTENGKVFPITFDKDGTVIDEGYDPTLPNSRNNGNTTIRISLLTNNENKIIEYVINIDEQNGNDNGGPIAYTEAALHANLNQNIPGLGDAPGNPLTVNNYGEIWAMRTFPAKIKDSISSFKITWRIIF